MPACKLLALHIINVTGEHPGFTPSVAFGRSRVRPTSRAAVAYILVDDLWQLDLVRSTTYEDVLCFVHAPRVQSSSETEASPAEKPVPRGIGQRQAGERLWELRASKILSFMSKPLTLDDLSGRGCWSTDRKVVEFTAARIS